LCDETWLGSFCALRQAGKKGLTKITSAKPSPLRRISEYCHN
jgi:hypothetical protein